MSHALIALRVLFQLIEGGTPDAVQVEVATRRVVRNSTAPPAA